MGFQKEFQGPPGNHAAIGLAPCLDLEPINIAVELRQQSERYPEVHNGAGRTSRAADFFLWGSRYPGLRSRVGVPGVSWGCRHRANLQRRVADIQQHLDNLRRKDSLEGAKTTEIFVRLGIYSASYFEGSAIRVAMKRHSLFL